MKKLFVAAIAAFTMFAFASVAAAEKVVTANGKGVASVCKNGGYKTFTNPTFKNQGQCVKFVVHSRNAAKKAARG